MYCSPRRLNPGQMQSRFVKKKCNEIDAIDVINKLQNKLMSKGKLLDVPLPQIVVEGGQSSGKSSVLESIIGRDFLPRGTGTVTRRPTVIQLHPSEEVYAEFLHQPNEKFTDFEAVKQEIRDETMRDPGPNGFSSKPISLKIYAPNVLKLTLLDLPGRIKNTSPDMAKESVEDVERMILKYIEQPNSIILAVSPANQDIFTSDAIELANKVDPKHERTLCVLTKLDLMDRGTDAKDILENRVLPLAKGYVGVVSRSQEDIVAGRDFQESLKSEKRFFENHPAYSDMSDRHGSSYLQKRLQLELIEHIRKTMPAIRKELSNKLSCLRKELKKMDQMMGFNGEGVSGAQMFMQRLVHQFIDDMRTNLFGHSQCTSLDRLEAGALISCKMHAELQEILKLPTDLTEKEFMNLIANIHGTRNILSIPSVTLVAACGSILEKYREPLEKFVDSISYILISSVERSCFIVEDFPALKEELVRFVNESIDKASEETKDYLEKYLDAQMHYFNGYHWDFEKSSCEKGLSCSPVRIWSTVAEQDDNEDDIEDDAVVSTTATSTDDIDSFAETISEKMKKNNSMKTNAKNLANIVTEYIRPVQKQIADTTLKSINFFLVHQVFGFINTELLMKLLNSSVKDSILGECEEEFQRRNDLLDLCSDLEEALVAAQTF